MITILFFAQLREQLKCEKITIEPRTSLTLLALRQELIATYPEWQVFLTNTQLLFSVNHNLVKSSHPINDGDEVAFFPPVTGG